MRSDVWKVVVIDDSPEDRAEIRKLLLKGSDRRYQFVEAETGAAGVRAVLNASPDCVVLDYNLPDMDALEVLAALVGPDGATTCPVVVLTGSAGLEHGRAVLRAGAQDYLGKSWMLAESLTRAVENAAERWAMASDLRVSENFNRSLMDGSDDCVKVLDTDGRLLLMNAPGLCAMEIDDFGPLCGQPWPKMWPADLEPEIQRAMTSALEGTSYSFQAFRSTAKGTPRWWDVTVSAVRNPVNGQVVRLLAVSRDITERKRAEEQLREREQFVQRILDASPGLVYVFNLENGRATFINQRVYTALGVEPELILADERFLQNYMHPDDLPAVQDHLKRIGSSPNGELASTEYRIRHVDGRWLWFASRDVVFSRTTDGRPSQVLGVATDITERKQAEQALRDSEQRMRLATEATVVGIWEWNVYTSAVRWDAVMFQIYGIDPTPDGLVHYRDWTEAVLPEDLQEQEEILQNSVRQLGNSHRQFRIRRRNDGECRHIEAVDTVRTNEAGQTEWVVGTNLDVTQRKQAEKALSDSDERYRAATAAVSDLIWTNNADGLMEGEQRGWGDFTGQSLDEYQGYGWSNAVHPEDAQLTVNEWKRAVTEKRVFIFEHRVRRRDGEWRVCSIRAVPILNVDKTIREWVGVHTDITERKRDEERLRQFTAELSEADRRKDEFLATLAHELRNPLAPIRNGLQLMKLAGGQAETIEQARSIMESQLTQMVRLIDDLMDVSRISRGKLEIRKERVPFAAVLNSALESSRPLIEQMGHELTVTLPEQPLIVDADMTRLAQVFLNLLNNAAKYGNRDGHILLNVERDGADVIVTVKDNGIGIAADQLPYIFEMFTQVDRSLEKSQGGLGIGLSLVKRLVEMHGGRVEAKSEGLGKGSEFVVRLPVVVDASKPQELGGEVEQSVTSSHRILVVDDSRDGANILSKMLRIMGNDTRTAYDGQEAVDMAGEFRPDVILLDIGLPRLNGYEACRRIREQSWGKGIVMIAVTGWGQDDDRRRSHEAGFDHHMVKPVDPQSLMKMLVGLQTAKGETPAAGETRGGASPTETFPVRC